MFHLLSDKRVSEREDLLRLQCQICWVGLLNRFDIVTTCYICNIVTGQHKISKLNLSEFTNKNSVREL